VKNDRPDLARIIATLVREATPVASLERPLVRVGRWALGAAAVVLLAVSVLGLRDDAASQLVRPWFMARAGVTLGTATAAAIVGVRMSVPGLAGGHGLRGLPWAVGLAWGALLAAKLASTGAPLRLLQHAPAHLSCVIGIGAIGLGPAVWLVRTLRQAAPLDARGTAGCVGLASAASGALAMQFICGSDAPAHHLLWHFAPVMLIALAVLALAPRLFRPREASSRQHAVAIGRQS
jgi:hypothetical protein